MAAKKTARRKNGYRLYFVRLCVVQPPGREFAKAAEMCSLCVYVFVYTCGEYTLCGFVCAVVAACRTCLDALNNEDDVCGVLLGASLSQHRNE